VEDPLKIGSKTSIREMARGLGESVLRGIEIEWRENRI
jgi:hypothetical protein